MRGNNRKGSWSLRGSATTYLFISSKWSVAKKKLLILGWHALKALKQKRERKRDVQTQISSLQSITVCVFVKEMSSSAVTQIPLADGLKTQTRPKPSKPNTTERKRDSCCLLTLTVFSCTQSLCLSETLANWWSPLLFHPEQKKRNKRNHFCIITMAGVSINAKISICNWEHMTHVYFCGQEN